LISDYIELSWKKMTPAIHVYYVSNITQQQGFHTQEEIFHKSIVRSMKLRNQLFKRAKRSGNFGQFKLAWNYALLCKAELFPQAENC